MDAIFIPAPAYLTIAEDQPGGVVTAHTTVTWDSPLAETAGESITRALRTVFGATEPAASDQGEAGLESGRLDPCEAITFVLDEDLEAEHVQVEATETTISIRANSVGGFWRGTHLVVQLLGPELVCALPVAVEGLAYPPVTINDSPSNPKRAIGLPLLTMGLNPVEVFQIVAELAAIGVNEVNLCNPLELEIGPLALPQGFSLDHYEGLLESARKIGVTVTPAPMHVVEGVQSPRLNQQHFERADVETALWPDAVPSFANGWVGQRDPEAHKNSHRGTELTWEMKQRIARYALFWAAQGIAFVDGPSVVWTWHLIRLVPQPVGAHRHLVGLLLAPGTQVHDNHVEMQAGKEGIIGSHLAINAMVNGEPAPVTLTPGHPITGSTTGVYQVFIPALRPGDDLRLAAIAQTNDGCSC